MERIAKSVLLSTVVTLLFTSWQFVEAIEKRSTTYYVYAIPTTPFDGNESMTVPCPARECYTLQEICETYNFTSNTTLVLLPGVHNITRNTSLDIANLQNFTIIGNSNSNTTLTQVVPIVWCLKSLEFAINAQNVTGLLLSGFEMHGCSGNGTTKKIQSPFYYWHLLWSEFFDVCNTSSIIITDSSGIYLKKVKVQHSSGVGLLLLQVYNKVSIVDCEFAYNSGGLMLISKMNGTTSFTGNFIEYDTFIDLEIIGSVFRYNSDYRNNDRTKFRVGGVYIYLKAETKMGFDTNIHNVTILDNNDNSRNNIIRAYFSWSNRNHDIVSLVNITKLVLVRSMTINRQSSFECNYGDLLIGVSGKIKMYIEDTHFQGVGYNIYECTLDSRGVREIQNNKNSIEIVCINEQCLCGAMRFSDIENVQLINIQLTNSFGGHRTIHSSHSNISLRGNCSLQGNNGSIGLTSRSTLFIGPESIVTFENNFCTVPYCSILEAEDSFISILNSSVVFRNNSGIKSVLLLHKSSIGILGTSSTLVFDSNSADNGGAISLRFRSEIYDRQGYLSYGKESVQAYKNCTNNIIVFINNHASQKGGAIFIDDYTNYRPSNDLLLTYFVSTFSLDKARLWFINNTADIAGSAIYGGWVEYDRIGKSKIIYNFNNSNEQNDLSIVSSNPVRVCMCKQMPLVPDCSITEHQFDTYPGKTVYLDVVAVGQRYGTVPWKVQTELIQIYQNNPGTSLKEGEYIQEVSRNCTRLQYNIHSLNKIEKMILTVSKENTPDLNEMLELLEEDSSFYTEIETLMKQLSITVTINDCPPGFYFNFTSKSCTCHPILINYQIHDCNIDTLKVTKPSQKWINVTFIHNLDNDTGVIVNDHCPFDYCKQNTTLISLDLEYPDDQCDFNRSGILCGGCQTKFSKVLGSTKCKKCSSLWTILLVPVVAIVGVLLIVAMLGLNLTVSTGMLNGLILFANIVRANHNTFFNSNTFHSYFIAWLNLDLGIEMCFYDGLDAYVKTWLQFIFPLYIWTIMIILIALSRRYVFVVRLCGSNVVQVLATLFLLSYAKLIRTIITIFQFTTLVYPDGYKRRVWLYDGNVDYLRGKHIPLFIAGLIVLLFLSIPYTVSLLFIQWLRKYNHLRLLRWVGKLKPLFDAYTGPFKEKHCYWFGVLLLVRVALYLVFSLNISGDTSLNLMVIGTTTLLILCYLVLVGGVYESTLANITDVSFLLNLSILTTGIHFYGNPVRMSTVSVSIAFCQFILITLYHLYLRITETRKGRQWNETLQTELKQIFTSQRVVSVREYFIPSVETHKDFSHSSIELKEPLLVDITANTQN